MPDSIEALEALLKSRPDRALEGALVLLSETRGLPDPSRASHAAAVAAYAALATGNPDRALELARQGQALKPVETGLRVRLLCAEGISHFQAGRYVESIAILEKALRLSRRSGDRTSLVRSLGNLGIA
ncbi:MAG TPA: tetratricopeptide repeat protein, partial [Spirochaetia bacterium]|nr:tetratricopeptide repeat protein [Spirochaetia bacterium]